jgi:hypothetical protein
MKNKSIFYLVLFVFLFACDGTVEEEEPEEVYLPDKPVRIDYEGTALYVHPVDNSENTAWGGYPSATKANSLTNGKKNTEIIVDSLGGGDYAAYVCDTLKAYGYDDWYLPSKKELSAIFSNYDKLVDLDVDTYWSSTEAGGDEAWSQSFYSGNKLTINKYRLKTVRCVRRD